MPPMKCMSWENCSISWGLDPRAGPSMLRGSLGSLLSFLQAIMTLAAIPRTEPWHVLKKKKYSMTLVQHGKADVIQDRWERYRDNCSEILQWGRKTGLNYKHSVDRWEFIAREHGGSQWMENY